MSAYLKALGLHVYLATTNKSYIDNDKYLKANAQAMGALKHTLSKDYLSLIFHCDSSFVVWNKLASPKKQAQLILEREPRRDESDHAYFMVQANDSLEVISDII